VEALLKMLSIFSYEYIEQTCCRNQQGVAEEVEEVVVVVVTEEVVKCSGQF